MSLPPRSVTDTGGRSFCRVRSTAMSDRDETMGRAHGSKGFTHEHEQLNAQLAAIAHGERNKG